MDVSPPAREPSGIASLGRGATGMALVRGLGRPHLVALTVNCVVGAGILGLPSKVYALVGSWSLLAWLAAAGVAAAVAACLAEVGSRFTETGGAYLYARYTFGPRIGFLTGWLSIVTRIVAFASVGNLLISYASPFAPAVASGAGRVGLVVAIVGGLCALLSAGIRHTAWVGTLVTGLKIGVLGLVVAVGLTLAPAVVVEDSGALPSASAFAQAALLMLFAFAGFEAAAIPSGEVRDPPRDLPIALGVGLLGIVAVYLAVQYTCIATVPFLGQSERPVAEVAINALGPAAGSAVGLGAVGMLTGTLLTQLLGTSRMVYAMALDGELPRALTFVHSTRRTPMASIWAVGLAAGIATLASTFVSAVAVTVATRVLTYVVICAALPALRRRSGAPPPTFHIPFGDGVAALGVVASLSLLAAGSLGELATTGALGTLGLGVRALSQRASAAAGSVGGVS